MDELDASTPDASTDELAHLFLFLEGDAWLAGSPESAKTWRPPTPTEEVWRLRVAL